jgi:hypothetical protein
MTAVGVTFAAAAPGPVHFMYDYAIDLARAAHH